MSWREDIQKQLEVFLGDGETFTPLWKDAVKEIPFNISEFEFPGLEGTLVVRNRIKGRRFRINFFFVGDDHLDVASRFEESAKDRRHWHIRHPYYGDIRCQPIVLNYDNTQHNVTRITGTVVETILGIQPRTLSAPTDELAVKSDNAAVNSVFSFSNNSPVIVGEDIANMNEQVNSLQARYSLRINNPEEARAFDNVVNSARSAVASATSDSTNAMRQIQIVAQYPARTAISVQEKVRYILDEARRTRDSLVGVTNPSLNTRRLYESFVGDLLNGAFLASSIFEEGEYDTRRQVFDIMFQFIDLWNTFVSDLDNFQQINFDQEDSFVANADNLTTLQDLFVFTIGNLEQIALEARREVSIILEEDSNIINLTHRFYGLDSDDENLDYFIRTNEIGINELLEIKKGRKILWYV